MASAAGPAPHPPPQAQQDQQKNALAVNTMRLKLIGDRIRTHFCGISVPTTADFLQLVYAFARAIDYALSAGDIPTIADEIPYILRKVYELRKDPFVQSSVMVLVISCKNACSNKWFQATDSADILRMANELLGNFCTSPGQAANDITALGIISKIMPRYYPQLKFERLVTSMEAKAGYDILLTDIFIERTLPRDEKIRLIVVQKENLDSSSCITSPPHVSFLVNGKGVDKRTNVSMETGPQFPSDITKMLKYGANIIQAVGYFNASYIIAVAFVNTLTSFGAPRLDDYVQPVTVDSADSDVLEGPSRVSLNCPISLRRIKTPIKGCLCKHYQCFDYDNYMEMNLRKPTWRCPYCNTPSNFIDLCIDQKMTKILQETGDDVIDVLLFSDGSWKVAPAHTEKSDRHTGYAIQQTGDTVETYSNVVDLINGNDDGGLPMNRASASDDTKLLLNSQDLSVADYLLDLPISAPSQTEDLCLGDGNNGGSNMALASRQNSPLPSTSGLGLSSFGALESILPQNVLCPIITDAVSPSLETSNSTSGMQHVSQETHTEIVQLQPQIGPLYGSEVRRPPIPRNVRREPVGVQALSVPPQNPGSSRRLQPNVLNCAPPIPLSSPASSIYQAHQVMNPDSVVAPMNSGGSLPRAPSAATPLHLQSIMLDMRNTSSHLPSQVAGLPTPRFMGIRPLPRIPGQAGGANSYRAAPLQQQQIPTPDQLRLHTIMNQTALAAAGQTPAAAQVRATRADIQSHLFPAQQSQTLRSQAMPRAATPQAVPQAPTHLQSPIVPTAAPSMPQAGAPDGLPELPVDENWCPTGRMRGSLTGGAYSAAIQRYLGQQSAQQQSQARPPSTSDARRPH